MTRPFDASAKSLLEIDPAAWVDFLQLNRQGPVRIIDADLSTVSTMADKVLRIEDEPQPWIVHIELQAGRDRRLLPRLLRYNVLLTYRHELPVRSVVVLLRPAADAPDLTGALVQRLPDGQDYLTFRYHVVRTWRQSVDTVLRGGLGTLPLAPLADVKREDLPDVLRRVGERLRNETPPHEALRLWNATKVLMGLHHPPEVVHRILERAFLMNLFGIHGIEESSVYQQILAEGRAEGQAEGLTRGMAEEARRILLRMGQKRFGAPGAEVAAAIEHMTERDQVEALIERLDEASGWDDLLAPPKVK